jgi:hypothetical protein
VLLRVERFGFSANNITYAVLGEHLGYFRFYPASAPDRGIIPVWGFASVIESRHDAVTEGQRFYGYLPMASHVVLTPSAMTATGFIDGSGHRAALPGIYNRYALYGNSADDIARERTQAILRPILQSAWLLADFLIDQGFFGADMLILSSASSKAAIGCAQLVTSAGARPVIGLTSPAHVDFVAGLGAYQRAVAYDQIASLADHATFAYVDLAGNPAVRRAVHGSLGDRLRASIRFGSTHFRGGSLDIETDLPGPQPVPFFGPAHVEKRIAELGSAGFQQQMNAGAQSLIAFTSQWLRTVEHDGVDAVEQAYRQLLDGIGSPDEGHVLSFGAQR